MRIHAAAFAVLAAAVWWFPLGAAAQSAVLAVLALTLLAFRSAARRAARAETELAETRKRLAGAEDQIPPP